MWRRLPVHATPSQRQDKVITPRHVYQHGSGVGSLKPQIYEATTHISDKAEKMIVSDRVFDPLCFRDVGVRLVSECGAHCESAGTSRQVHENAYIMSKKTVKVNPNPSLTRHAGFDKQRIVDIAHTVPQERIQKRILEPIMTSTSGRSRSSGILNTLRTHMRSKS